MRGTTRTVVTGIAVLIALVLQTTVLPQMGWPDAGLGLVPGMVLLVVVATALLTDTRFATLTGFAAGLLVDLTPPAEHAVGRWALALTVVGYVVGRLCHDREESERNAGPATLSGADTVRRPALGVMLAAIAGGSFVGTSVFALTGVLLGAEGLAVGELLRMVATSVALDVAAGIVVVPLMLLVHRGVSRVGSPDHGRVTPRRLGPRAVQ